MDVQKLCIFLTQVLLHYRNNFPAGLTQRERVYQHEKKAKIIRCEYLVSELDEFIPIFIWSNILHEQYVFLAYSAAQNEGRKRG